MKQIELKALAKINLGLDVLGRRENGYHDVRMIMQSVYLYDDVVIVRKDLPGIEVETNLHFLPTDENNIAYKAAAMLMEEFKLPGGVRIVLNKHIPVAAGMAGGSSNAAAVLFGMNKMFRLGLSQRSLMERGVRLGADVPYCIMRGTVLAEGIGEILTPLAPMPKCYILIAKPALSASTRIVYEKFDRLEDIRHPDIDGILAGIKSGNLRQTAAGMGNVLEQVMLPEYPVLQRIKEAMLKGGALNAMMTGSGPTMFGIFEKRSQAKTAMALIKKQNLAKQIYVTNVHRVLRRNL